MEKGEAFEFSFDVDFDYLATNIGDIFLKKRNTNYGEYTLQLFYRDTARKHRKAVKELKSNKVKVYYKVCK